MSRLAMCLVGGVLFVAGAASVITMDTVATQPERPRGGDVALSNSMVPFANDLLLPGVMPPGATVGLRSADADARKDLVALPGYQPQIDIASGPLAAVDPHDASFAAPVFDFGYARGRAGYDESVSEATIDFAGGAAGSAASIDLGEGIGRGSAGTRGSENHAITGIMSSGSSAQSVRPGASLASPPVDSRPPIPVPLPAAGLSGAMLLAAVPLYRALRRS